MQSFIILLCIVNLKGGNDIFIKRKHVNTNVDNDASILLEGQTFALMN